MSSNPVASAADVEWIDTHGDAQICGVLVTRADIAALADPDDRHPHSGALTPQARERIAAQLTIHLRLLCSQARVIHLDATDHHGCELCGARHAEVDDAPDESEAPTAPVIFLIRAGAEDPVAETVEFGLDGPIDRRTAPE